MTIITASTRTHATSEEVAAELAVYDAKPWWTDEISDSAALAIASWWQGPAGPGRAFTKLAGSGKVDLTELLDAIASEYDEAKRQGGTAARELDLLATWALNHPSRGE